MDSHCPHELRQRPSKSRAWATKSIDEEAVVEGTVSHPTVIAKGTTHLAHSGKRAATRQKGKSCAYQQKNW